MLGVVVRQLLLGSMAAVVTRAVVRHRKRRRERQDADRRRDESLEETFPASDAPATQDFDIPVNRR
jgi:hypothetical protein